jgi:RNA polymerase II elongation factor ELL
MNNGYCANNCCHNRLTVSTPEMRALNGGSLSKAKARASHLKPLAANSSQSLPSSPGLGASSHHHAPPLSAGLDSSMPHELAIKRAVLHYLAVKPRSQMECRRVVGANTARWMERYAKKTGDNEWTLLDRLYKELDVWDFKYRQDEERQAAIDNAIRAYDRMRLPKDDVHWQKLLTKAERGQGKVLSRLNLSKAPLKSTPVMKAKTIDKKTGLPKRTEGKKADKDAAKPKKKDASEEEPIKVARPKTGGRTPRPDVRAPKPGTPRTDATRERKGGQNEASKGRKDVKASTSAKSLLNKPKNPSPLSASPPVNAADFEDDHPVHKALSAAVSPKRLNKRKAEELADGESRHRLNGVKRKAFDMDSDNSRPSTPVKQRRVNGSSGPPNGHRSPQSDNSSGSPPLALSWRQSVDLAKKFRQYYDKYAKLYMELSNSVEPPSQVKRDQLLSMHRKLEEMKREVRSGAL